MITEQEKLKPCPFCGGQVQLETVKSRAGTLYGVVCRNTGNRGCTCAMEQVPSRSAEAAIARWNMRKPEDELRAEIDRLAADVVVGGKIIEERNRLLYAIPECAAHGPCVPYAIQWVQDARAQLAELLEERGNLKAENEALRKRVADLSPFKGAPYTGADTRCLACGEHHYGIGGLPCPKMRVTAQAVGNDDVPDFTPGNGNKARRRAEALGINYDAATAKQAKS